MNVQELRQTGCKVRVCHRRPYTIKGELITKQELYNELEGVRFYLENIRGLSSEDSSLEIDRIFRHICANVSSRGGLTTVDITTADGKELHGMALCSNDDNFNRKYGLALALHRAFGFKDEDFGKVGDSSPPANGDNPPA